MPISGENKISADKNNEVQSIGVNFLQILKYT